MSNRTIDRQKMRRDLHARAAVPALYLSSEDAVAQPVSVRVHTRTMTTGGDAAVEGVAERREIAPRIIFLVDEVAHPARNGFVSLATGEAYQLGEALPVDGTTITVAAARLSAARLAQLDLPFPECG